MLAHAPNGPSINAGLNYGGEGELIVVDREYVKANDREVGQKGKVREE